MPFSNLLCELGQGTHPLWAPIATNENAGIGQGGFSEATFSPDSLSVVDSMGTAGPVSSSQPYQGMLMCSGSPQLSLRPSSRGARWRGF